jgi:hypothetical protein
VLAPPRADIGQEGTSASALSDELLALWEVEEQPFTSSVPIVGPVISAFRNLWSSVATKWYVRPMLRQQVQFNGAVVRALTALSSQPWDDAALLALLAKQCGDMALQIAELEARLAELEQGMNQHKKVDHE